VHHVFNLLYHLEHGRLPEVDRHVMGWVVGRGSVRRESSNEVVFAFGYVGAACKASSDEKDHCWPGFGRIQEGHSSPI
jgi:hypothetical protein